MRKARWTVVILAALSGLGCGADHNRTGWKFVPGMYDSVPYDAHDANPVTPDGKTLLLPPEGTVPVGFEPFLYGPGEEEAMAAGMELTNPYPANRENLSRGRDVYEAFCAICHDSRGEGNGPIIGRFPNPPNLLAPRAKSLPDGQVFHILTWGQGVMPGYRSQMDSRDRWMSVLYMRQLQADSEDTRSPDDAASAPEEEAP